MASPTDKQLTAMAGRPIVGPLKPIQKKVFAHAVNDKDIVNAMAAVGGAGRAAASYLGLPYRTLLARIRKNPWLQDELQMIREDKLDFAESMLMKLISEGNPNAIIFYLKTIGKDRGFTEQKQEIAVNTNVAVAVVPGLLDTKDWAELSKKYQAEKELEVNRQLRELDQREPFQAEEDVENGDFKVVELFKSDSISGV